MKEKVAMNMFSILAQAGETSNAGDAFGGFLLFVIICILVAMFNAVKKKKEFDVYTQSHSRVKQR